MSVLPSREYTIAGALAETGKPAVEDLTRALPSPIPGVRYGAATGLGRLKDARAMSALIHALRLEYAREPAYQEAFAILSLGPVAVKPFVDELTQMMSNWDREVPRTVDVALGCVKSWIGHSPREVAPFIAELKRRRDPEVEKWIDPRFP